MSRLSQCLADKLSTCQWQITCCAQPPVIVNGLWSPTSHQTYDLLIFYFLDQQIDIFSSEQRSTALMHLTHENLNSVNSLNVFHPSVNMLAGGNSSGKVYLWTEWPCMASTNTFASFLLYMESKVLTKETRTFQTGTCCPVSIGCRVPLRGEIHSTYNIISLLRLHNAVAYSGLRTYAKE